MILVDTSVWIDFLRDGNDRLRSLLVNHEVLCHPFVVGELSCGNLKNRRQIINYLSSLVMSRLVAHEDVLEFVEHHHLFGRGIGWVDAHLLASAFSGSVPIWTNDKRLRATASGLKVAAH